MKFLTLFLFLISTFVCVNGAVKTWDGGGGDLNLATAANWVGGVAPVENDDLVFPDSAVSLVVDNNFVAAMVFRSISIDGKSFTFNGNSFTLTNGFNASSSSQNFGDGIIINTAVTLIGTSQTFTVSSLASVVFSQVSMGTTNLTFSGAGTSEVTNISGSGILSKEGNGRCSINDGVNFVGSYSITAGTLNINANTPNSPIVNNGGVLGGSGTVGKITNNTGQINLTSGSVFILNFATNDLILDTGDLILSSPSSFNISISSDFTGTILNSQLNVTGSVMLSNPTLNSFAGLIGARPRVNTSVTIINNDGIDLINGIFANLPEGAKFFARGSLYRVSYVGGTGNDMTLTALNTPAFDFDGDGKTDISTYKPSNGVWSIKQSSNNLTKTQQFGLGSDLITPADYDGDFKTDIAVFRPSTGIWYRLNSTDNSFFATQFGFSGDIPVPGDYNAAGRIDIAVFRQGIWYINGTQFRPFRSTQYGFGDDKPIPNDFDGDGSTDIAVYRPSTGFWYYTGRISFFPGIPPVKFGISTDILIPADYDGDGRADYAVFRPSDVSGEADFYILQSSNNSVRYVEWGSTGDIPQLGDFDGDGKIDIAIYRPLNSSWHLLQSTNGYRSMIFGDVGDRPISSAFVR